MEMYIAIAAGILSLVVAFALMTKVKGADEGNDQMKAVSYTHLTLPTNREV